jgi:hypothetical protein
VVGIGGILSKPRRGAAAGARLGRGRRRAGRLAPEELGDDDRVVVLLVAGGVENRHPAAPGASAQVVEEVLMGGQLAPVPGPELRKALRAVIEPLAQLGAGRQLLRPGVELGALA